MQLTQKENSLLKDLKDQEKLCIDKYSKHASCAVDPQLKNLFTQFAQMETKHLSMLDTLSAGTVPPVGSQGQSSPSFSAHYGMADSPEKQNDCYLCSDLLTAEKHASHLYDTCIFEFTDDGTRNLLNSIQSQEQNHGKTIYDYMSANSMY